MTIAEGQPCHVCGAAGPCTDPPCCEFFPGRCYTPDLSQPIVVSVRIRMQWTLQTIDGFPFPGWPGVQDYDRTLVFSLPAQATSGCDPINFTYGSANIQICDYCQFINDMRQDFVVPGFGTFSLAPVPEVNVTRDRVIWRPSWWGQPSFGFPSTTCPAQCTEAWYFALMEGTDLRTNCCSGEVFTQQNEFSTTSSTGVSGLIAPLGNSVRFNFRVQNRCTCGGGNPLCPQTIAAQPRAEAGGCSGCGGGFGTGVVI